MRRSLQLQHLLSQQPQQRLQLPRAFQVYQLSLLACLACLPVG